MQILFIVLLLFIGWGAGIFFNIPTFDLDESLFRLVADEMKSSGKYFNPTWNENPFYHKPPLYYWLIIFFSHLIDGPLDKISVFSARLPSFIAVCSTVFLLFLYSPRFINQFNKPNKNHYYDCLFLPILIFGTALFPSVTASSVLFDPLLTFFSTPALIIFSLVWLEKKETSFFRSLSYSEKSILGFSLALATMTKGIVGFLIPLFALFIHSLLFFFSVKNKNKLNFLIFLIKELSFPFFLFLAISFSYYYLIYLRSGSDFLREFFIVQHFQRASQPMEAHDGSFFYYPLILFFTGGTATSLFIVLLARKVFREKKISFEGYSKWGFPLSWVIAYLVFYSFISTKLPHYIWSAWPGFTLAIFFLFLNTFQKDFSKTKGVLHGLLRVLSCLPLLVFGFSFIFVSTVPERFFGKIFQSNKAAIIIESIGNLPLTFRSTTLLIGGVFLFLTFCFWKSWKNQNSNSIFPLIKLNALSMAIIYISSGLFIMPFVSEIMVNPFQRLAEHANKTPTTQHCLKTFGSPSPTISLHYRKSLVNRCNSTDKKIVIAPIWKKEDCLSEGRKILIQDRYLLLCGT